MTSAALLSNASTNLLMSPRFTEGGEYNREKRIGPRCSSKREKVEAAMPTNHYINVIERMMCVLEAFGPNAEISLRDLTLRTGMVKSSIFRILYTLQKLGYISKSKDGLYSIHPKFSALISPGYQTSDLIEAAHPFMQRIVDQFKETVNLGVLDGNEVLYIHVIESPLMLRLTAHAGIRSALHASALGKCLSAYLRPEETERLLRVSFKRMTARTIATKEKFFAELGLVRTRGFATDNSEETDGIRCVGTPIFDAPGKVAAALSISGPESRMDVTRYSQVVDVLRAASRGISRSLKLKREQSLYKQK
jgi:IclR family transcriptional regulator, KDG regulon repressor